LLWVIRVYLSDNYYERNILLLQDISLVNLLIFNGPYEILNLFYVLARIISNVMLVSFGHRKTKRCVSYLENITSWKWVFNETCGINLSFLPPGKNSNNKPIVSLYNEFEYDHCISDNGTEIQNSYVSMITWAGQIWFISTVSNFLDFIAKIFNISFFRTASRSNYTTLDYTMLQSPSRLLSVFLAM
jgi:hypothetical protein